MDPTEKDVVVKSWTELQDELFRDSWNNDIQRFRSPFVYRGLSNKSYRLVTSLIRLDGAFSKLEKHLLRSFRKYGQGVSQKFHSIWHLLTIAQHYGLPTRLLDWTYSPYVALHFATANHVRYGMDGVIWIINYQRAHDLLPDELKNCLHTEGAQAFTIELLSVLFKGEVEKGLLPDDFSFHDVIRSLEEFDKYSRFGEFLLFFEPPSMDERIINQYALFSVMPNSDRAIDDWLQQHPQLYRRIIIPAELKWEFRDKLDQCNITERVLFPGLDGLSSYLRRYYSPKD
ncbi:FRG domain-containing protein [bacterium]|nr:FRG domain-containing protein [bacterium]